MDVFRFAAVVMISSACFADCNSARLALFQSQKAKTSSMVHVLSSNEFSNLCKDDQNRINQIVTSTMKIRLQDSKGKDIDNSELVATVVQHRFLLTTVPADEDVRQIYADALASNIAKVSIYNYMSTKISMPIARFQVGNIRGHHALVLIFNQPITFEEKPNVAVRFLRMLVNQNFPRTIRKSDIRFDQEMVKLTSRETSSESDTLLVNYRSDSKSYDSLKMANRVSLMQKPSDEDDVLNIDMGGAVYDTHFNLIGLQYQTTEAGPVFDGIPSSLQQINVTNPRS